MGLMGFNRTRRRLAEIQAIKAAEETPTLPEGLSLDETGSVALQSDLSITESEPKKEETPTLPEEPQVVQEEKEQEEPEEKAPEKKNKSKNK